MKYSSRTHILSEKTEKIQYVGDTFYHINQPFDQEIKRNLKENLEKKNANQIQSILWLPYNIFNIFVSKNEKINFTFLKCLESVYLYNYIDDKYIKRHSLFNSLNFFSQLFLSRLFQISIDTTMHIHGENE